MAADSPVGDHDVGQHGAKAAVEPTAGRGLAKLVAGVNERGSQALANAAGPPSVGGQPLWCACLGLDHDRWHRCITMQDLPKVGVFVR